MTTPVLVLEQLTLTAPFGVRFWDVAANAPAEPDLSVIAFPSSLPELARTATRSPGGVYSFSGLPGLRAAENGAGDDAYWSAHPPVLPYTIRVTDPALRYLSIQFSTLLPVRGLFATWESPLSPALTPAPDWVPLFSSPARTLPGPSGVVRATLQDDSLQAPARWALFSIQAPGVPLTWALADDRGLVSLYQPYPEPVPSASSSPLTAPQLTSQTWTVSAAVFYSRIGTTNGVPDLKDIVQQDAAFIWRDSAHTSPLNEFPLSFGSDLVCRSLDSATGRQLSVLLITSPVSPL